MLARFMTLILFLHALTFVACGGGNQRLMPGFSKPNYAPEEGWWIEIKNPNGQGQAELVFGQPAAKHFGGYMAHRATRQSKDRSIWYFDTKPANGDDALVSIELVAQGPYTEARVHRSDDMTFLFRCGEPDAQEGLKCSEVRNLD